MIDLFFKKYAQIFKLR